MAESAGTPPFSLFAPEPRCGAVRIQVGIGDQIPLMAKAFQRRFRPARMIAWALKHVMA
jgi:hypothetical protein